MRHPTPRTVPGLLALALLAAPAGAEGEKSPPALKPDCGAPMLRDGERLFYRAKVWKGPVGTEIGTATLSVVKLAKTAPVPGWHLVACAQGATMGFTMNSRVVARLDPTGTHILGYEEITGGSRPGGRRFKFEPKRVVYVKKKHCPGCDNPAHFLKARRDDGLGTGRARKRRHCPYGH